MLQGIHFNNCAISAHVSLKLVPNPNDYSYHTFPDEGDLLRGIYFTVSEKFLVLPGLILIDF